MNDLITRILLSVLITIVCLPLAYVGISHGSSYGLELGIFLLFANVMGVYYLYNLKKESK